VKLELLELSSARGVRVAALEYEARRPRGVTLAVAHGYSSSKHNLDFFCGFMASHGYRVVSIDFPGHKLGASGGRLDSIDALTDALDAAVRYARSTVAGAVSIASGYGRPSALQALGGLSGVDLRSAYVDGLTLQAVAEATEPLVDAALAALAGRPVLYVAADHDGMVSRKSAEELFARAPEPKTFATVASDHTNAGENSRAAVLVWLNERHPR